MTFDTTVTELLVRETDQFLFGQTAPDSSDLALGTYYKAQDLREHRDQRGTNMRCLSE